MKFTGTSRNKTYKLIRNTSLIALAAVSLSACGGGQANRGYIFDDELAAAITPGIDNRQSVEATLGTATIQSTFDENTWYYVSTRVRVRPVFWPDAQKHRVMAINFNEKGVVAGITEYDMSHMKQITPVAGKTETKGRKLNLFQQLFMNIGRFSQGGPGVGANGGSMPNGG